MRTKTDPTNAVLRTNAALRVRVDELLDLEGVTVPRDEIDPSPLDTNEALRARLAQAIGRAEDHAQPEKAA